MVKLWDEGPRIESYQAEAIAQEHVTYLEDSGLSPGEALRLIQSDNEPSWDDVTRAYQRAYVGLHVKIPSSFGRGRAA